MIYSTIDEINKFVTDKIDRAFLLGFDLDSKRDIPYGLQLSFFKDEEEYKYTIYYSKKKGISVIANNTESSDSALIQEIFSKTPVIHENKNDGQIERWIGTDEAGKGDYFGPLSVAAYYVDRKDIPKLQEIEAVDCKLLTDKKVLNIAEKIITYFPNNYEIHILPPREYNDLMEKCKKNNKNLNDLLAYMHSYVIKKLCTHATGAELILTDQFSKKNLIEPMIKDTVKIPFTQRTKAESDMAVACASVLARYAFLNYMEQMSQKYETTFPKGATHVIDFGVNLYKRDKNLLYETAKLHFKTTGDIEMKIKGGN